MEAVSQNREGAPGRGGVKAHLEASRFKAALVAIFLHRGLGFLRIH